MHRAVSRAPPSRAVSPSPPFALPPSRAAMADDPFVAPFTAAASPSTLQSFLSLRDHLATSLFSARVYYHLVEALFFVLIIYLALTRAYKPWTRNSHKNLSAQQQAAKLAQWKPEPLAAPLSKAVRDSLPLDVNITDGGAGPTVTVDGKALLNFASNNFLALLKHRRVEEQCLNTMRDYGCGACGPRGFYGTTDVHLECEDTIAAFCDTPTAILYSFGAATGNSTIPAFVKRGDLVVIDSSLNYTLLLGVRLSRAHVRTFRHNDTADLRRVLEQSVAGDATDDSQRLTQRRIIIVEGVSHAHGDVCPLDEVVRLKDEFKFRLLLDESLSLGVLGRTGRGALEEFGVPRKSVEIATADLGNAIAAVGGFCVGADDVVDHQRLSGAGYCFSASQPPFLAKAATTAIHILQDDGEKLVASLRQNIKAFRSAVNMASLQEVGWLVQGDRRSPIVVFRRAIAGDVESSKFTEVQRQCFKNGLLISRPLETEQNGEDQGEQDTNCLRVSLSAGHTYVQVLRAAKIVHDALRNVVRESLA